MKRMKDDYEKRIRRRYCDLITTRKLVITLSVGRKMKKRREEGIVNWCRRGENGEVFDRRGRENFGKLGICDTVIKKGEGGGAGLWGKTVQC